MNCQECGKEVSCGCVLKPVPTRSYSVCNDCKRKILDEIEALEKAGKTPEVRTPNLQGV